jgi:tetratricopeptide (TPR) repeat protein
LAITIAQADDLLAAGDFPAALAGAQSAAAAHPKEAVSHLMVGRVLLAMGRAQESAESFRRAIQLDPLAPPAYRLLGNSLAAQGRFSEALDAWERWGKLGDKAPEEAALAPALLQGRDAARILDSLIRRPIG